MKNGWVMRCRAFGLAAIFTIFPLATQAAVGRMAGAGSVDANGAASYSIPLNLPPGTNGLTPSLSLGYSSNSGDGRLGVGWAIGGLSAITRCPRTWAQDGESRDVRNDYSDRFCLDGNKLRLTSGAGSYGQANATYQTEIETFSRVTSYSTAGNGPAYFFVEGKNGLVYEYGNSDNSRIESVGQTTARTWALNKVRDRSGNAMEFTYTEEPVHGSYRIASIQYTSNSSQGVAAPYTVEFAYETRPSSEIDSGYVAGSVIKEITRLDRIDVKYNTSIVRRYDLTYEGALSSTSKSRLASVQECAGSPLDCLPATTFVHQNGTHGLSSETNTGQSVPTTPWPMDVNGDGRDDLVYSSSATAGSGTWMVMLANATGGYDAPTNTAVTNTNYAGAIPIDYNADGFADLLVPYSGGTWWVMLGSASGLAAPSNTGAPATATGTGSNARAIDINGDGLEDLVWADLVGFAGGDAIRYRLREWGGAFSSTVNVLAGPYAEDSAITNGVFAPGGQPLPRRVPDFNGDGRGDVIFRRTSRILIDGSSVYNHFRFFEVVCPGAWNFTVSTVNAASTPYFGDFNGDGKTDIVYYDGSATIQLRFSRGTSFTSAISSGTLGTFDADWGILDWDGDGYDDVLLPSVSTGTWHLRRSTGEALGTAVNTGLTFGIQKTVADINGDGLLDLASNVSGTWRYRTHAGSYPDLLQTATDGYGNFMTFSYAPLPSANYSKYTDATYPEQDYQGSMYVVNSYNASNGIGGSFTNSFWYYGARLNLQGRGLEGFHARRTQDSRNNLYAYDYFNRLFPYTGTVFQSDLYQSNGTTRISRVQSNWTAHSYGVSPESRSLPYINQSTAYHYEVAGTHDGLLLSMAVTVNTVDSATGTVYDSTRTTTESAGANGSQAGALHVQRLYHSSLFNDTTHWCFGRPQVTQAINSHTMPGGTSITRTSNTTWDGVNCRPTQSVVEPASSLWQVTTDYGYDNFGNVDTVTLTPASGQGQIARSSSVGWGATGRFPETVTNAKGQVTSFGWDPALGSRTSVTDPNLLQIVWTYDSFGRMTRELRPDGTATDYVIAACNAGNSYCGVADLRSWVQITARDTGNGAIRTDSQYFDGFDRPRYNYQQLQSGGNSGTITSYDALGRVSSRSTPFVSTDPVWYTTYTYDPVNRPIQVQRQTSEADLSSSSIQIAYQGLRIAATDPLGRTSSQVYNAIGQVVQAIDAANSDTDYEYDAFGNLLKTRDVLNNEITLTYNVRGMKMTSSDPDMGAWSYNYFPLGELKSQTDAKNQTASFTYDALSRPLTRVETEATTNWTWDTATTGVGQLASVAYGANYTEAYTFDLYSRPAQTSITTDSVTYQYDYGYQSATGLLDTLTYPVSIAGERFKVRYGYQYGFLASVQSYIGDVAGTTYWQSQGMNARGQTVLEQFGNGLQTSSGYDRIAGWLDDRVTGPSASGTIQNLTYSWNKVGSLIERKDVNQNLTENFYYDNLERLDYSTLNSSTNLDLSYDAIGNITSKSDVGTYAYHATRKHAVVSTTGLINNTYGYDANGNMSSRNGQVTTWTSFNYPSRINQTNTTRTDFNYTHDRRMRKQTITTNGNVETWWYLGGLFEKRQVGSTDEYRHFIHGANGPIAVRTRNNGGSGTYYLTTDHLGSTNAVTGSAATTLVNESYEAFGKRRGSNWTGVPSAADNTQISASTKHGFTFHEHLTNLGLIHMQGRVFDPSIGRFMSADPFVQAPFNSQSLNRYSYTFNNPLSYTDPSGFFGMGTIKSWIDSSFRWIGAGFVISFSNNTNNPAPPASPNGPSAADNMGGSRGGNTGSTSSGGFTQYPPGGSGGSLENSGSHNGSGGGRGTPAAPPPPPVVPRAAPCDMMPACSTVSGNPFSGFDSGPGVASARAGYAFLTDPDISPATKEAVALSGLVLMTGGTIAFSGPTIASLFGLASAPTVGSDGFPIAGGMLARAEIAFGQATVKSTFAYGPHAGKTIGEVAAGLRSGAISADSLTIGYVIRNGQAVALNNRSLLALRRAGVAPTVTRNLTGDPIAEALLDGHLRGGLPSYVIRVRGGPPGTSLIE